MPARPPGQDIPVEVRRALLRYGAALGAAGLAGCAWLAPRQPVIYCPGGDAVSAPQAPLTIDAHAHVFNGTDLPIAAFFQRVLARAADLPAGVAWFIGNLLEDVAWTLGPTAAREIAQLDKLLPAIAACPSPGAGAAALETQVRAMADDAFAFAKNQLMTARRKRRTQAPQRIAPALARAAVDAVDAELDRLDAFASYGDYRAQLWSDGGRATVSLARRSARGMLAFVIQNFQYRYVSIHDYLSTYNQPGKRVVDLLMPMVVDYDWAIAQGQPTASSLSEQVAVMEKLAIATGGRVHGFVPFDPLREVAHELGLAPGGSFSLVQEALERGFIGVKLYPPMGFAPYGNAALHAAQPDFWRREWIHEALQVRDLGRRLDAALDRLYALCAAPEHSIPIMAHSAPSNAPAEPFAALAGARYWRQALARHPGLRINFGHFGDTAPVSHANAAYERARAFTDLMASADGNRAYADAGYFVEAISDNERMRAALQRLYTETQASGGAALANRFLYGTDWEMIIAHGPVASYLADFERLFARLEGEPAMRGETGASLARKFFGANAVNFAGLARGEATRTRLQRFYDRHRIATPEWMVKADRLTGSA